MIRQGKHTVQLLEQWRQRACRAIHSRSTMAVCALRTLHKLDTQHDQMINLKLLSRISIKNWHYTLITQVIDWIDVRTCNINLQLLKHLRSHFTFCDVKHQFIHIHVYARLGWLMLSRGPLVPTQGKRSHAGVRILRKTEMEKGTQCKLQWQSRLFSRRSSVR